MKNDNFITIQGWMVNELNLSGNELICYALIYGFSQDEESEFRGSQIYISKSLNVSRENTRKILQRLIDKNLIKKRDEVISGVKFCRYSAMPLCNDSSHPDTICMEDDLKSITLPDTKDYMVCNDSSHNTIKDNIKETINKEYNNKDASEENWRESYLYYQFLVVEAKNKLLSDQDYQAYIEQYYPNSDYQASINKMLEGFWNTEEGWMWVRKHRKGKTINMYTTLKKNLDKRSSIVYKSNSYQKRNTAPKINVVNLNPEVKPIDEEGTLSDGSILKGGHRYYWSNLYGRLVSVPLNASPRPEGDMYEYDIKLGWYECK